MTDQEIQSIANAIVDKLDNNPKLISQLCPLNDVGITAEDHKQHHVAMRDILDNTKKIKTAFWIGLSTGIGGILITIFIIGIKHYLDRPLP